MVLLLLVLACLVPRAAPLSLGIFLPQACLDPPDRLRLESTVLHALGSTSPRPQHTLYDSCSETTTIGTWVTLLTSRPHDVIIGPGHAALCEPMARLASFDTTPLISYHCAHPPLAQPYPFFLRTVPSARDSTSGLAATVIHFRWQHVALVVSEGDSACWQWGREAYYVLTEEGLTVAHMILLTSNDHDAILTQLSHIEANTKG
jgi:hypothetical protein